MKISLSTPTTMLRASYTISPPTLQRFNAAVPQGERSRVMEHYMQQALQDKKREFAAIADAYMTDPAFATYRSDEALWDTTVADGLDNLS
jgi:GR25 family glycosyltransferase involved in LPS biosynthesis